MLRVFIRVKIFIAIIATVTASLFTWIPTKTATTDKAILYSNTTIINTFAAPYNASTISIPTFRT